MKRHSTAARSFVILPFVLALLPAWALARQVPVTGQMMGESRTVAAAPPATGQAMPAPAVPAHAAPTAAAPPARQPRPSATVVGNTTGQLFQMQADGGRAGKPLPMLGAEASASYDRYLKSFNHDIPEFYKTTVGKDSNGSGGER